MRIDPIIVNNVKDMLLETADRALADLKERIALELMNLELSLLYQNKAYGSGTETVTDIFSKLSQVSNQYKELEDKMALSLDALAANEVVYS